MFLGAYSIDGLMVRGRCSALNRGRGYFYLRLAELFNPPQPCGISTCVMRMQCENAASLRYRQHGRDVSETTGMNMVRIHSG